MAATQILSAQWVQKLFLIRHRKTYEPHWEDNTYARLSAGLFWEADSAWRKFKRLQRLWTSYHYIFGTISVVLAAVAGFGGLSELLELKQLAFVALSSAATGALATFLNSDKKRIESAALASAWDSFRDDVTLIYEKRPAAPNDGLPPNGWDLIVDGLQSRAKELRSGKTETALKSPSWSDTRSTEI